MTLLGRMFERRGLNDPVVPLSSAALVDWLSGTVNDSGMRVTEKTALSMPAVWRAVSIIASTCAGLPLEGYEPGSREPSQGISILEEPNGDFNDGGIFTAMEFWELEYVHQLCWGNAYARKNRDGSGAVVSVDPIPPWAVKVGRVKKSDRYPWGKVFEVQLEGGGTETLTPYEVLHLPGLGYDGVTGVSPIRLAAQGIGMALASEKYGAKLFSSGSLMSGILQTDQRLDQTRADELSARWRAKVAGLNRAHDIVVLGSGAKFQPIMMPNTDAQFLESRKFQVIEIARMFGIPPFMLMDVERTTSWGTGIEQQQLGFITHTLKPYLNRVEQRVSRELLPGKMRAKYNLDDLLRGDSAARSAFYVAMRNIGVFSRNDIRAKEDMSPIPGGDDYIVPLNMAPAGPPSTEGGSDAASSDQ